MLKQKVAFMNRRASVGLRIEAKVVFMLKQKVASMKRQGESWPSETSKDGLHVEAKGDLHEKKGE
jgi:hypothetical protein